jgi:hypothetical protein
MDVLMNNICPLCGKPNGCARTNAATLDVECWCIHAKISEATLARVPATLKDKACLCVSCAGHEAAASAQPKSE